MTMSGKYETKPGDITIFRNRSKEQGDKRPDYDGKGLDLNGNEIRVALWVREGQNGKFFSGKISHTQERQAPQQAAAPAPARVNDDDIPF